MMVLTTPHVIIATAFMLALSACAAPTVPTPVVAPVSMATVTRNDIRLSAVAESATVAAGEAIEITATLELRGRDPLELTGSGSGLVFFSVTRLEDGLTSGPPGSRLSCKVYELTPGEPMTVQFTKSGGLTPDDRDAAFKDAYFADPELTLAPGTWRIDVTADGSIGRGCGGVEPVDLAVELVVFVTPD